MTESKNIEASKAANAENFRMLFESMDEGFCIIESIPVQPIDFRYVYVNHAFVVETGVADVVGKTMREVLPEESEEWFEIYNRVLGNGEPVKIERKVSPDRVLEIYAFSVKGYKDQVAIKLKNVTERARAREAKYFLASIVESSEDSIVTINFNNIITSWNKGAERLYGYAAEEVIGKSLTMVTLPGDLKQLVIDVDRIKHSKKVMRYETVRLHKQGQLIDLEIELSPVLNERGEVIGVSTFARDITKRKRIQADLAFLAEVSKDLVDLNNISDTMNSVAKKIVSYFNLSHCRFIEVNDPKNTGTVIYGWQHTGILNTSEREYLINFLPADFVQRSSNGETIVIRDVFTDALNNAEHFAANGIGSFVIVPIRRNDANLFWLGFYDSKARDWRNDEIELLRELTTCIYVRLERARSEEALHKSEEKLRELNARLQETDKAKTAFFNNVSHEFRTPLTLLIGPLEEFIKSGGSKLTPGDMQKLLFAYRNASRLQKLVTTLLDFARIEAGKLEAYYQPADFSKLTSELSSNFRSAIEKAGLKYVVKAETITEPIYLNREMWEKIVFNLLSNAFKFTHKGKIEVLVREKKKNAELRIKDTGVGIAAKDIDRIFDRFTRIEGANARTNEGTGIGLALVQELVNAHGGTIKVKSEPGVGTEFIVSIPKGKTHFAKHQIFENRERHPGQELTESYTKEILGWLPEDVKSTKKKLKEYQRENASRILIVEDNADMREYLSTILSEDDHKTLGMEDGQKVLTFLEEGGEADLILSDVMMPTLDGFEMLRQLKGNPKYAHIPVIIVTAKTDEESNDYSGESEPPFWCKVSHPDLRL